MITQGSKNVKNTSMHSIGGMQDFLNVKPLGLEMLMGKTKILIKNPISVPIYKPQITRECPEI
jgi:hypothetical protein